MGGYASTLTLGGWIVSAGWMHIQCLGSTSYWTRSVAAYLDDIVVYSNSWEEHKGHIRTMFAQLQGAGLTVKPRKCQFAMAECLYLGHIVGNGCVCPEVSKLEAIESQQQKKNKSTHCLDWLGTTANSLELCCNYCSSFWPDPQEYA